MTTSITLKDVAIYHPNNVINNDFYINHFQEQGKDIHNLLQALGREK